MTRKNKFAPLKSAIVAGLMLGSATVAAPVMAQSAPVVPGLAVANVDAIIANSNAYKTAEQQRATTYKAQLDQAKARRAQLQAQLEPMVDKFNTDSKAANPNQASLQQQAQQIQALQQSGQNELNQILKPVVYSQAYVQEQIEGKLEDAIKSAMNKKKVSIVLAPDSLVAVTNNAYNINQDILNELNTLIPSAQVVPPAGWEPRQVREAQAKQQAAAGGTTAGPQVQGR